MNLLIVDDDFRQRELLEEVFSGREHEVAACGNGRGALLYLENRKFDTVITDLKMPDIDGTEVLKASLRQDREVPVIITGYGTVDSAIKAMKIGAYDYIQKPFDPEELVLVVEKALNHFELIKKNREMAAAINIRELENCISRAVILEQARDLQPDSLPLEISGGSNAPLSTEIPVMRLEDMEKLMIKKGVDADRWQ